MDNNADFRAHNLSYARKLTRLAWSIECALVATGLGIAVAQMIAMPGGTHFSTAIPVFGVFAVLALAEFAKIPAAIVVFHAGGWRRLLAGLALVVAATISFETVFNGFERFTFSTTRPAIEATQKINDLEGEITRLQTGAGIAAPETTSTDLDAEQRELLQASITAAEASFDRARADTQSAETRQLQTQLDAVLAEQKSAADTAEQSWQDEQDSIMQRLQTGVLDNTMTAQLNARMAAMPARQSVIEEARAPFVPQILEFQSQLRASISEPSPEAQTRLDGAARDLDEARANMAEFESQAADRHANRLAHELTAEEERRNSSDEIKSLEAELIEANRLKHEAAENSQMHRWTSFVFDVKPQDATEAQVKTVSAAFGAFLAFAAAMTGSIIAMFAEWFRSQGIAPTVVTETERVEVPVNHIRYVPLPQGPDFESEVRSILETLPDDVASELKKQLLPIIHNNGAEDDRLAA